MFRSRARFLALAVTLVAVNVAGLVWLRHSLISRDPNSIRVLSALPVREVDATDRFTLVFDEKVASSDLIEQPLPKSPFAIEPPPPGRWVWLASDCLEYRLERPLPAGTVFHIQPVADFERLTGRKLVGEAKFEFRTRALRVVSCEFTESGRDLGQVAFTFNQPVNPHELGKHLSINGLPFGRGPEAGSLSRHDGPTPLSGTSGEPVAVAAEWLTKAPSSGLTLGLRRPKDGVISVAIAASAHGSEGPLPMGSAFERKFRFDRPFALGSVHVYPVSFSDPTVRLNFTRCLDRDQAVPAVAIVPPVDRVAVSIEWDELQLCGAFEPGRRYSATVPANLLADDETVLGESQTISFEIPDRSPGLRFKADQGILNPQGNLTLDLEAVNLAGVELSVSRVTANNIVAYLHGAESKATSRSVLDRTVPLKFPHNEIRKTALDLRELLGSPLGVYRIQAESSEDSWIDDQAVVAVTDLAITAKVERQGLWAWVTSLSTGKPMEGVTVQAMSYNNQGLGAGVTGADGVARMPVTDGPDGPVWVVLAQLGDDLAYLQPDRRNWVLDDVDQGGRSVPETYDVMLYSERGVYRLGDTIHLTGIVREAGGDVPPGFPLSVAICRPDGRTVKTLTVSTADNCQGVFQAEYTSDEQAQLGRYTFAVAIPGAKQVLGQTTALVEAFLPVRFEVEADASAARYGPDKKPEVAVSARYLFGKPASGLPVAVTGQYRSISFESQRYPEFSFQAAAVEDLTISDSIDTLLDESGQTVITPALPESAAEGGLWRAEWCVTVTEPGSRSVSKSVAATVDSVDHHLGLYSTAGRVVPVGTPVAVEWIQLTGTDELATPQPVTLVLQRVEYDWVIKEVDGRRVWQTEEHLVLISQEESAGGPDADPRGLVAMSCPVEGRYRVTARDAATLRDTAIEIYATSDQVQEDFLAMEQPERLELVLNAERFVPGSTASVLVRSPFLGTLALTVESDQVVSHQIVELSSPTATVELTVPQLRGSAYLSGTVVRAIDPARDEWLPHRAMGLARLTVDHSEASLDLIIEAPEQAEPAETIEVAVLVNGPIDPDNPPLVHLWAVDDGILLPTNYRTPDPRRHFFGPRQAVVETSDAFGDLLPDIRRPESMEHIGAGEDEEQPVDLRRNPVAVKRREPAVVWRTAAPVEANGRALWEIPCPDATGRLRFMAVAVDGDRYGATDHDLTLSAPLMVEANWPRFVAPGDRFEVPVKLFSQWDEPLSAAVAVHLEGPVVLGGVENLMQIPLGAGESATVWLSVTAAGTGPVEVRVTATAEADGETLKAKSETRFSSRPPVPPHVESSFVQIQPDQPITIDPPAGFVPGTARATIRISPQSEVELLSAFEAVVDYPYGCVEQTTSRLYALLHARSLLERALPDDIRTRSIPAMIEQGIVRLQSMQTRSGGLAYWPGHGEPHLWGSAYAGGLLAEARKAGYSIDKAMVEKLSAYLERSLRPGDSAAADANLRAHLCRVLAELDAPPAGWMTQLAEQRDQLDQAGSVDLAAAWVAAGRKDRAAELITPTLLQRSTASAFGERFSSPLQQDALLLSLLCSAFPEDERIFPLAESVRAARRNGRWGNTLENATALGALASFQAEQPLEPSYTGQLLLGDRALLDFDHTMPAEYAVAQPAEPMTLRITGTGSAYANISVEGLPLSVDVPSYDRRLRVRRQWTDLDGNDIAPAGVRVGDLILVSVSLQALSAQADDSVSHIAVVDAIPAGMEVENPRLETSATMPVASATADHVEFLDDRVLLFASATDVPRVFHYTLRATTAGAFVIPPIQAASMYDGSIASLNGVGHLEIQR